MDGRGRWIDNVFVERLWRSLKYEDVYLKGYADGREARAGIGRWIAFYNEERLHQGLADRTPMAVWREGANPRDPGTNGPVFHRPNHTAVDMPLRLDNADALPTCSQPPPPQQQQQKRVA